MWAMLQQDAPDDYVVAMGVTHSVQDLVELAFGHVGLDWRATCAGPGFPATAEVDLLIGDASKARACFSGRQRLISRSDRHDGRRRHGAADDRHRARARGASRPVTGTSFPAHASDAFSPPLQPFRDARPPCSTSRRSFAGIRDEVLSAVVRVCDSQRFVMGPEVEAFEHEMAELLGVTDAIGVSSGTDALLVSLMALGVGPGDEVVTSTYSFFATAGAVSRIGATQCSWTSIPTFNIDVAQVARTMTLRTRALMPVHLFGQMADMDPLVELAAQARVPIIEDAAQAIGARYAGRPAGGIGALGCFSFFPSKNLGAFGDAGLVTTNDGALASRVRLLRTHGAERQYHHRVVGGNFRIEPCRRRLR